MTPVARLQTFVLSEPVPNHDDEHLLLDSVLQEDVEFFLHQFMPAHTYLSLKYEQETLHNIARKLKQLISHSLRDQEMR